MKKVLMILVTAIVISVVLVTSLGVTAFANAEGYGYAEPAPNAGDCVPDGSGTDGRIGPDVGYGPAPNSGDGIPDGSGF